MTLVLTIEELEAIELSLNQAILDGFAESENDPIVTALNKVSAFKQGQSGGSVEEVGAIDDGDQVS